MMTRAQIELVQSSHALLQPMATQAAALFYDKLFEREPGVGALFKGDMAAQGDKLMTMIGAAVRLLDQPVKLDIGLAALGARHAGYGVRDEHHAIVGGALLDTLAAAMGSRFTPAMREAWAALYAHVSHVMQDGSRARLAA